jgi:hypothetical protein
MLPPFNANGDLPPGVHKAAWSEVEERFGRGRQARVRAFGILEHVHALAARTGALETFYVFGSFVSGTPDPRDVDVLMVMQESFRLEECPGECLPLFTHEEAQARYGATVFWLRHGVLEPASMQAFLLAWQTTRDGKIRGILEIA